jgi:hypothetical protein
MPIIAFRIPNSQSRLSNSQILKYSSLRILIYSNPRILKSSNIHFLKGHLYIFYHLKGAVLCADRRTCRAAASNE